MLLSFVGLEWFCVIAARIVIYSQVSIEIRKSIKRKSLQYLRNPDVCTGSWKCLYESNLLKCTPNNFFAKSITKLKQKTPFILLPVSPFFVFSKPSFSARTSRDKNHASSPGPSNRKATRRGEVNEMAYHKQINVESPNTSREKEEAKRTVTCCGFAAHCSGMENFCSSCFFSWLFFRLTFYLRLRYVKWKVFIILNIEPTIKRGWFVLL